MIMLRFVVMTAGVSRLHDLLSCLAKFDENVSLEACEKNVSKFVAPPALYSRLIFQFRISSLNSSKTAYSSFTLDASFFAKYHFTPDARNTSSKLSGEPSWTCCLQNMVTLTLRFLHTVLTDTQALLSIFKRRAADSKEKDTALERCEVE